MFDFLRHHNLVKKDALDYSPLWMVGIVCIEEQWWRLPLFGHKGLSEHCRKLIEITWASLSISSVSSVACTYMWSNGVGTVSIHMTRKISCTFVNIWEMTGFQSRFLEYDTCINLLILNIESISSSCFQLGLKIFIFYHWSKILRQG